MIRHVVLWKLIATDADAQKSAVAAMADALEALVGQIDGLISLTVRQNVANADSNFSVILQSDHTGLEALEAYATHPLHIAAGAVVKAHTAERAAIDFEL
ncbi:MAG: Dabb family protein [Rhodoglobus sp.]